MKEWRTIEHASPEIRDDLEFKLIVDKAKRGVPGVPGIQIELARPLKHSLKHSLGASTEAWGPGSRQIALQTPPRRPSFALSQDAFSNHREPSSPTEKLDKKVLFPWERKRERKVAFKQGSTPPVEERQRTAELLKMRWDQFEMRATMAVSDYSSPRWSPGSSPDRYAAAVLPQPTGPSDSFGLAPPHATARPSAPRSLSFENIRKPHQPKVESAAEVLARIEASIKAKGTLISAKELAAGAEFSARAKCAMDRARTLVEAGNVGASTVVPSPHREISPSSVAYLDSPTAQRENKLREISNSQRGVASYAVSVIGGINEEPEEAIAESIRLRDQWRLRELLAKANAAAAAVRDSASHVSSGEPLKSRSRASSRSPKRGSHPLALPVSADLAFRVTRE